MTIEIILFWVSVLVLSSVIVSKLSDKFTIPILLLFLGIGMLAGSEGIGGIYFDNAKIAQSIGIVALIFIIFAGGIDTNWKEVKPVVWHGLILSTIGVLLTAVITGTFAMYILNFSFLESMVFGSIVSSTDAAAVFNILRSKNISLKNPLRPLLEFESGSNDPMAVFLTISFINLFKIKDLNMTSIIPRFFLDMGIGIIIGYLAAKFIIFFIRRLKLEYEGLYPILMISLVLLTFVVTDFLHGNGFMAIYIAALLLGQSDFPNKKGIIKFHDGLSWLMQIAMFVTLGLLVFPSHIMPLVNQGILITAVIILIARPISVFLCLSPFKIGIREKIMISWVGLKGSAPIILATFPFMAGISQAHTIFNIVFFVVIVSVLIQGASIPIVSKFLRLNLPLKNKKKYPIEFEKNESIDAELNDMIIPYNSTAVGKTINELGVPEKCLIVLISRNDKFVIPTGSTIINSGDVWLVLANTKDFLLLQDKISKLVDKDDI